MTTPTAPSYADRVEEWIDVNGYAVAVSPDDPLKEYEAVRTAASVTEYPMLFKWHVEGPDAVTAVDAVFLRSVRALHRGRVAYGAVGGNPAVQEQLTAPRPPRAPPSPSGTRRTPC